MAEHRWSRERLQRPRFSLSLRDATTGEFFPLAKELEQFIRQWASDQRKPGRPPAMHHNRWVAEWKRLWTELNDGYEPIDGDRPLSKIGVCDLVAEDDFKAHPEDWKYDPRDFPENARKRVWMAVRPHI